MERTRGWAKATLILSAALALCSAVSAQVLKGVQPGSNAKAITNNDVVQMVKEGTPEATIIATIRANPARFDVSLDKMLALQRQGISTHVLNLMAIVEMRRRKGASGRSGTNADELSPQPYPPKGILLTPGAQQSMLGTQANSPSGDGSKSALVPVVQQPAATDGTKQGATAMSPTAVEHNGSLGDASVQVSASGMPTAQTGTLNGGSGKTAVAANRAAATAPAMMPKSSPGLMGTSQTMSAQGNASSSTAITQPARPPRSRRSPQQRVRPRARQISRRSKACRLKSICRLPPDAQRIPLGGFWEYSTVLSPSRRSRLATHTPSSVAPLAECSFRVTTSLSSKTVCSLSV